MATHSSILAWKIPWTEELGRLQSMGLKSQTQLNTNASICTYINIFATFFLNFLFFLLVGGSLLYNIVVSFATHWNESAMDLHVFPILIPPPATFFFIHSSLIPPLHKAPVIFEDLPQIMLPLQPFLILSVRVQLTPPLLSWDLPRSIFPFLHTHTPSFCIVFL